MRSVAWLDFTEGFGLAPSCVAKSSPKYCWRTLTLTGLLLEFLPLHRNDRFSSSALEPRSSSRRLYAGSSSTPATIYRFPISPPATLSRANLNGLPPVPSGADQVPMRPSLSDLEN